MLQLMTLASIAVLTTATDAANRTILHVDKTATSPTHDGSTWCTAFTDLQDAIDIAIWDITIRVAGGTYTPDRGTGDPEATFQLWSGCPILRPWRRVGDGPWYESD